MVSQVKSDKLYLSVVIFASISILWGIFEMISKFFFDDGYSEGVYLISLVAGIILVIAYLFKKYGLMANKLTIKTYFIISLVFLFINNLIMFIALYINWEFIILEFFAIIILPVITLIILFITEIFGNKN